MQASDIGHGIEQLLAVVPHGPGDNAPALEQARAILFRLGRGNGATGYTAEKLEELAADLATWFGPGPWPSQNVDSAAFSNRLLRDIDRLRKALARGSQSQD